MSPSGSLVRGGAAVLWEEAQLCVFFADEAHFRADAELRGKWVLKGKPVRGGLEQSRGTARMNQLASGLETEVELQNLNSANGPRLRPDAW